MGIGRSVSQDERIVVLSLSEKGDASMLGEN